MNIWIFNHYAQGPELPGGTRHYDLARELIKKGYTVTIFAAGFHYTLLKETVTYNDDGYSVEDKNGVKFIWVKTYEYNKNNFKRMLNIISYAWKLNFIIPKLDLIKPDIIIGSTVHPFAPIVANKFAKKYKIPFIFEIRDLWPQTFIDMGIWNKDSLKSKFFKYIEKITVKNSDKIIVLSPLTIDYLKKEYMFNKKKVLLLPNGINENFITEINQEIKDKVDITYIGGIDSVHGLEFLVKIANKLKNEDIIFNIYGDGKERQKLESMCSQLNLNNIVWHGSIKKVEVPKKLACSNILFVSTSNVNYGSENKLYEYMASAKPIISAVSANHNDPVSELDCGLSIDRSNVDESASKIKSFILNDKSKFIELGMNGQEYVLQHRLISILAEELDDFIRDKNV